MIHTKFTTESKVRKPEKATASPVPLRRFCPAQQADFAIHHLKTVTIGINPFITLFKGIRHLATAEEYLVLADIGIPLKTAGHPYFILDNNRCILCRRCIRACPVGIPLTLLNRKLERSVAARFDAGASEDPATPAPIGAFKMDDPQEFIL